MHMSGLARNCNFTAFLLPKTSNNPHSLAERDLLRVCPTIVHIGPTSESDKGALSVLLSGHEKLLTTHHMWKKKTAILANA